MNDIELTTQKKRMSSYEIAELTGKQHSHIMRDIRKQLEQQNINESVFGSVKKDAKGQERPYYNLNYQQTMILITGYSIPLRAKVIKRWQELEVKKPRLPQSYSEALRELATTVEQNEQLKLEVETNKPKVEFYDQVTDSKDAIEIGTVANVLNIKKVGRNKLFSLLRDKNILRENNQPYREYIDRGYFRIIEQKYTKPDGSTHINIKTVVYQKGVDYIRKILTKEVLK